MGYYTEFQGMLSLRKDTPSSITSLIDVCINEPSVENIPLPAHQFFSCNRWKSIFSNSAFMDAIPYFIKIHNGYYKLFISCCLKDYDGEIGEFIDWITPYIAGRKKKTYIGWRKGEDQQDRYYIHVDKSKTDESTK